MSARGSSSSPPPRDTGPLSRRFRNALRRRLAQRLVPEGLHTRERTVELRDHALRAAGVEMVSEIVTRPDGKGVYQVRHPDHGLCILKTVCATCHPDRGLAARSRIELLHNAPSRLFPTILESGTHWSIEELVDGPSFGSWVETRFRLAPFARFLQDLRAWSLEPRPESDAEVLEEWQLREVCATYLAKGLFQLRYFSLLDNVRSYRALVQDQAWLREQIERLDAAASRVAIPAGFMCGDMYPGNLVVALDDEAIVSVDHETLGPGYWGFDIAYLLSAVARSPRQAGALRRMREEAHDLLLQDGPDARDFFALLESVLTRIATAVWSDGRE